MTPQERQARSLAQAERNVREASRIAARTLATIGILLTFWIILALVVVLALAGRATATPPSHLGHISERLFADVTPAPRSGSEGSSKLLAQSRTGAPTPTAATPIPDPTDHIDAAQVVGTPRTAEPSVAPLPPGVPAVRSGIASTYGPGWDGWIALPEGPGWRVRVCGPGDCRTVVSNDAGPDLAAQRDGRIVDLDVPTFEAVCGVGWRMGLCQVSLTYLRRATR